MTAKHRVYFLQANGGGPIKIGTSRQLEHRTSSFQGWIPGGVELIADIPGNVYREAALKWLLRDLSISGEWFRSCPPLWRLVLNALDHGDLPWLPHSEGQERGPGCGTRVLDEWEAQFGGRIACAAALGYSATRWGQLRCTLSWHISPNVWGRWAMAAAIRAGTIPGYLIPSTDLPKLQAA